MWPKGQGKTSKHDNLVAVESVLFLAGDASGSGAQ